MITDIELAGRAFLEARFATMPALDGLTYHLVEATSREDMPEDRPTIVVEMRENPDVLKLRALRTFFLVCRIVTPAQLSGSIQDIHRVLEVAIQDAWEDDPTAVATAWNDEGAAQMAGWHSGGVYPGNWEPGREENAWTPGYAIYLGVAKDGV